MKTNSHKTIHTPRQKNVKRRRQSYLEARQREIEIDNERLENFLKDLVSSKSMSLTVNDVMWLCNKAYIQLNREPSLLEISPPIKVCGDIHGQFDDLVRVFNSDRFNPNTKYLFLGDYVDRGDRSLEVLCLLLTMKARFPNSIYLIRGNHESPEMSDVFGFADEVDTKLDRSLLDVFYEVFDILPIAAIVGGEIFCVHGGLSPSMESIDEIRQIERPTAIPEEGFLADLLWSDPSKDTEYWGPNDRGATYTWGISAAEQFFKENNLTKIIRGHQMAQNGYDYPFYPSESVITVFTASSYANKFNNHAAFITIDENNNTSVTVLNSIPYMVLSVTQAITSQLAAYKSTSPSYSFEDFENDENESYTIAAQ